MNQVKNVSFKIYIIIKKKIPIKSIKVVTFVDYTSILWILF